MSKDFGSKPGSAGVASGSDSNVDRRERLRQLALETIDLSKDPYFMKNHLGTYECKLCLTLHTNEGSYLAHTQGKRHQMNLARRAARDQRLTDGGSGPAVAGPSLSVTKKVGVVQPKRVAKIGRPGFSVTKQRDAETNALSLLFQVDYPEIEEGFQPRHRFMSTFEQKKETPDRRYQYILFAAEPYETIAFKIPNYEIERYIDPDRAKSKFWTSWDKEKKSFLLFLTFKNKPKAEMTAAGPSHNPLAPM
jgi:splicing factor 3A subunit 2